MVATDRSHRRNVTLLIVAALLSVVASLFAAGEGTRRQTVEGLAVRSLDQLALLSGIRDDAGNSLRGEPLPVVVVQEGGSMWVREAVIEAVERDGHFADANSRHLLRIEVVETDQMIALQLRLWRQGWDLRTPELLRGRVVPWVPVLAGVLGALVAFLVWRVGPGLLVAGFLSQTMLAGLPWPAESIPPVSWIEEVKAGPLLGPLFELTRSMPSWGTAVGVAVVVFCLMLVWFDHRRSKERKDSIEIRTVSVTSVLLFLGGLLWLEAALRGGMGAAMHTIPGAVTVVVLALAWLPAIRRSRERIAG